MIESGKPATRSATALIAALACVWVVTLAADTAAAHRLRATDYAQLHMVSARGETLYETGRAQGTLPGTIRVHMHIGSTFHGRFVISARGGTIAGRGRAKAHGSGKWESFAGWLKVTGGSGRFKHAHGRAKLHGTFNRDSYALTIKTSGTLRY